MTCLLSGRMITLRASADKGQQKSSVRHCPIHNVRQHSENASETSIWRELTASNHEIHHFSSWAQNLFSSGSQDLLHRIPSASQKIFLGISSVCPRNFITNERADPEHVTKEDTRCHTYVCSVLACFPSDRIVTLRASAGKGQQRSSVSHWPIHNVRQHSENASGTSIWRELTASNHEIHHFS